MRKKDEKLLNKMEAERERIERKADNAREKKSFKEHMNDFKDFCVKDTSRMILLIAILVVAYMVLNLWLSTKQLAQIDLTEGKIHTITDRSKEVARSVNSDIVFYLWSINDNDAVVDIIRQYNRENSRIQFKTVTPEDVELVKKYGFEDGYISVVGVKKEKDNENGEEYKDTKTIYINSGDLYTFDDSFNQVDLTEQKLTNSLVNLNSDKQYHVYFLEGKTEYTTEDGMSKLKEYLEQEYYLVDVVNVVANPAIPEDCDILAIMGLREDLSAVEAENICQFIEKGGDVIISNDINPSNQALEMPNFNRVLNEYSISLPNNMLVYENDPSRLVTESYQGLVFQGTVATDHEITRLLANVKSYPIITAAGAIELDYNTMAEKLVQSAVPIITTTTRGSVSDLINGTTNSEMSTYAVAAAAKKTASNGQESRAVIIGTTGSFSDTSFFDKNYSYLEIPQNATFIMNSFAFVSNQGELNSIRKTSSINKFTVTKKQDFIVRLILAGIPAIVVVVGTVVFLKRRKLK